MEKALWPSAATDQRELIDTGANITSRAAGSCTAAMFLKEFAGGRPWAHLDIAETASADDLKPWQAKGATGVAVLRWPSWRLPAASGSNSTSELET